MRKNKQGGTCQWKVHTLNKCAKKCERNNNCWRRTAVETNRITTAPSAADGKHVQQIKVKVMTTKKLHEASCDWGSGSVDQW